MSDETQTNTPALAGSVTDAAGSPIPTTTAPAPEQVASAVEQQDAAAPAEIPSYTLEDAVRDMLEAQNRYPGGGYAEGLLSAHDAVASFVGYSRASGASPWVKAS